jgi:hypothetical protein
MGRRADSKAFLSFEHSTTISVNMQGSTKSYLQYVKASQDQEALRWCSVLRYYMLALSQLSLCS